jgi:translation elongation factor P/translation initiation factor 5A
MFNLKYRLILAVIVLHSFCCALESMEKEQQANFELVGTSKTRYKVTKSAIALSKLLDDSIQDIHFDSSQPIEIEIDDRVLGLLVSCLEKIAPIVRTEDEHAYNQAVAKTLEPLFTKQKSPKKGDIGSASDILLLKGYYFSDISLLLRESNRLNIPSIIDYLIKYIADYLLTCKDLNEMSSVIKQIEELAPDIKKLIKEQLIGKESNKQLCTKLIACTAVVLTGHIDWVSSVAFSSDGKYALTGSWDATARIWDIKTGEMIIELKGHTYKVSSVAFSPDGKYALTGSYDNTARIWDVNTGKTVKELKSHTDMVSSVAFSADSKYAMTGSWDQTARIWDVNTGKTIKELIGHTDKVSSVAFSVDGKYAITGSNDCTARIWDLNTGKAVKELKGQIDRVTSVAFSADGKYVITGSEDYTARIWNVSTGQTIKELKGHIRWVYSVAFSTDGKYALTGSCDRTARIWDITLDKLSLPELVLLIKLDQLNGEVAENAYFKEIFGTLPEALKPIYLDRVKQEPSIIKRYKKPLSIAAALTVATISGYLFFKWQSNRD